MNKMVYSLLASGFVLGSGLVSCSKEIKTQDVYTSPPPLIVQEKETADIKVWDKRPEKVLDLQDAFDVSVSKPTKLEVQSICNVNGKNTTTELTQENPARIYIFQIMPDDLLVESKVDHVCSFTLKLFNSLGSSVIYKMGFSQVVEKRRGTVTFESEDPVNATATQFRYVPQQRKRFLARFENKLPAQARVLCPSMKARALSFDHVIDLASFDYHFDKNGDYRTRIQTCRVIVTQPGVPGGISPLFLMVPELAPLKFAAVHTTEHIENLLRTRKIPLGEIRISNPDDMQRIVRPVRKHQSLTVTYTANSPAGVHRPKFTFQKGNLVLEVSENFNQNELMIMNPGQTVAVKLFLVTELIQCNFGHVAVRLHFKPEQPFVFQNLNFKGEMISTFEIPFPEFYRSQDVTQDQNQSGPTICNWPDKV